MAGTLEERADKVRNVLEETAAVSEVSPTREGEDVSAKRVKVVALRKKLSMAKDMLEELLEERDSMERTHTEAVNRRKAELERGEDQRSELRAELSTLRKSIVDKEKRSADLKRQDATTLLKVRKRLARAADPSPLLRNVWPLRRQLRDEARELRQQLAEVRGIEASDSSYMDETLGAGAAAAKKEASPREAEAIQDAGVQSSQTETAPLVDAEQAEESSAESPKTPPTCGSCLKSSSEQGSR